MRYFVQVDGESWVVDIEEDAVLVNGEPVSLDLTQSGIPELYSVLLDGASHEVLVSSDVSGCDVTVGGQVLRAEVQDEPTRILMKGRGPVAAAGGAPPGTPQEGAGPGGGCGRRPAGPGADFRPGRVGGRRGRRHRRGRPDPGRA